MKKIAKFIVNNNKKIISFYLVLIIISAIAMQQVTINSDLSSYLPNSSMTKQGQKILEDDFNMLGQAVLAVKNKEMYEISAIVKEIESLDGVKNVIWLGKYEDTKKPVEFMNEETVSKFVKEDAYILNIFLEHSNNSSETFEIMDTIDEMIDGEYYLGGSAMKSKGVLESALSELPKYLILSVIIIFIILLVSTSSYFEPIFFLITIGVSIVVNMGTNIFLGDVSAVTFSATAILQLALSMDYSIFLLHTFHDERAGGKNLREAMKNAITTTFTSISASALTTAGGFIALLLMRYGMGADLGIVLAKGVFFSLIAVITLQPCLIILFDSVIEKYTHKVYLPTFKKVASFSVKYRYVILAAALLIVIPAFQAQSRVDYNYLSAVKESGEESELKTIVENLGTQAIVIAPNDNKAIHEDYIENIRNLDYVNSITGLYTIVDKTIPDSFIPKEVLDSYTTDDYTYYIIELLGDREDKTSFEAINSISNISEKYFQEWYISGDTQAAKDLSEVTPKDFVKVAAASAIIIFFILLLAFRSIKYPILLVFVIELGIWINLSITYFMGANINFISYIIISSIQLGATVDYAILLTDKYRKYESTMLVKDAVRNAVKDSGRSILVSALIIFSSCLSVHYITSNLAVGEITLLIGRGALISTFLVIILLPALLVISKTIGSSFNKRKLNEVSK